MGRGIDHRSGSRVLVWPWTWALGPVAILLVICFLWTLSLKEIAWKDRGKGEDDGAAGGPAAGAPDVTMPLPEERIPLEEARKTLARRGDLSALAAARRLWEAGYREEVVAAIEDPSTWPALRIQLLALASGDRSGRIEKIAKEILAGGNVPKELDALCRAILGGAGPAGR